MRGLAGVAIAVVGCATALASGGWSAARPVPGVSIQGQTAEYTAPGYAAASCSSPQNCTVAYQPAGQGTQVFSVTRHNGAWGTPRRVPGLRTVPGLDLSLACASAGDCLLAGDAPEFHGALQVMVARLAHGAWTKARPVPGLAALRPGERSLVSALACGRTGWCALAGQSQPSGKSSGGQPFVVSEHNGTWSRAQAVPGLAALTKGWAAGATVVSCDPRDTCTATGYYGDHRGYEDRPYAVTDRAGRWGPAQPIAGTAPAGGSDITALSCPAPGDCSAAGTEGGNGTGTTVQMFTVTETGGTWHPASPLRGTIPLPYPADTQSITALTCTAPGQCTALGVYGTSANSEDSVPVDAVPVDAVQEHGTWSAIHAVRGLPDDAVAWVTSVSCASAGTCAAGGYWLTNPSGDEHSLSNYHAFLAAETRGTWSAQRVPGLAALHSRNSAIHAVSCQPRRGCSSIGDYLAQDRRLFISSRG
jgi:hypothetical protein